MPPSTNILNLRYTYLGIINQNKMHKKSIVMVLIGFFAGTLVTLAVMAQAIKTENYSLMRVLGISTSESTNVAELEVEQEMEEFSEMMESEMYNDLEWTDPEQMEQFVTEP